MKVCTAISSQCEARVRGSPLRASASVIAFPRQISMPPPRRICAAFSTRATQLGINPLVRSLLAEPAAPPPLTCSCHRMRCTQRWAQAQRKRKYRLHGRASFDNHAGGDGLAPLYSCSSTEDSAALVGAYCTQSLQSAWQYYPCCARVLGKSSPLTVPCLGLQSENDLLGSSYANALVDLASDKNNLEEVHADMDALASILKVRRTLCSTAA